MIIGPCNPYSTDPRDAFTARYDNTSGFRLYKLMCMASPVSRREFDSGFDRRNLCTIEWNAEKAQIKAQQMRPWMAGRKVLVLGEDTRRCFRLPKILIHPVHQDGAEWRCLPHPSGRCRWYNDPNNRLIAS